MDNWLFTTRGTNQCRAALCLENALRRLGWCAMLRDVVTEFAEFILREIRGLTAFFVALD